MRIVDIYRQNGEHLETVAMDCIQYGNIQLSRTPITKMYIMADGSPCMYAAACDTAAMTVQLECGREKAEAIARNARLGRLIFAGLSWGVNGLQTNDLLPPVTGAAGYITGAVQVQPRSVRGDLYTVSIPVQLEVGTGGGFREISVPVVRLASLTVDGVEIRKQDCRYVRDAFVFPKPIVTTADTAVISYTVQIPEGLQEPIVTQVYIWRDGSIIAGCTGDIGTLDVPLALGENALLLRFLHGESFCKTWQTRLTIYREG